MIRKISMALGALFFLGGLAACLVSAYYVFKDWHSLNVFYARFEKLAMSDAPLRSIIIASSHQAAFRLNCFADGVGVLLGAILALLGWNCFARSQHKDAVPLSPQ